MARVPSKLPVSKRTLDRALMGVATVAIRTGKLSPSEKEELAALVAKGAKSGRLGWTTADRLHCIWLIRKAGPETLPNVPPWLRRIIRGGRPPRPGPGGTPQLGSPAVDPLDRLEKLARLRENALSPAQFERQRAVILADPHMATYGVDDNVDPLDRVERVSHLERAGVIEPEQAAALVDRILGVDGPAAH